MEWYCPKCVLPYLDTNGIKHLYHPDFYVKTFNCFIEVKSKFIADYQNSNNKCKYIKEHYPFVKWLETEESCETFLLEDLNCNFIPEKEEEDISYWLNMESIKKEKIHKDRKIRKKISKNVNKNVTKEKYKIVKEKAEKIKKKKHETELKLLQESGIDFSKFGWVNEAKILLGWSTNKVGNYIRKNFPELNVFTRKN